MKKTTDYADFTDFYLSLIVMMKLIITDLDASVFPNAAIAASAAGISTNQLNPYHLCHMK